MSSREALEQWFASSNKQELEDLLDFFENYEKNLESKKEHDAREVEIIKKQNQRAKEETWDHNKIDWDVS